ncbi:hypothetical protein N7532_000199 [Penicillium argentinense]|uniref:Uncharacterized protein n=1 Tax=Penicillium argentinense TaxID=1131581 RepID=A0A9W9KME3_9EURO|nr:uncharacterized protein N7532_000199 [Penicillium argentinense]KAJ5112154.1 hypothetical protein N7532_000199 [Penicillium argentinense]
MSYQYIITNDGPYIKKLPNVLEPTLPENPVPVTTSGRVEDTLTEEEQRKNARSKRLKKWRYAVGIVIATVFFVGLIGFMAYEAWDHMVAEPQRQFKASSMGPNDTITDIKTDILNNGQAWTEISASLYEFPEASPASETTRRRRSSSHQ